MNGIEYWHKRAVRAMQRARQYANQNRRLTAELVEAEEKLRFLDRFHTSQQRELERLTAEVVELRSRLGLL